MPGSEVEMSGRGGPPSTAPAAPGRLKGFGVMLAGGAAILVASLANFLRFNDYPLLAPEVGLAVLALCAAAAAIALLGVAAGRLGRALAEGLLLFLAIDLNTDLWLLAMAAGAAAALLAWFRGVSLLPFLAVTAVIAAVVGALGVGGSGGADEEAGPLPPTRSTAPVMLHLIMDEHIGIAGLPADNPASRAMAERLRDFYVGRGFRLYGRAYSRYFNTPDAIPDMLATRGGKGYFAALRQAGYRLNVHQSGFLDLCAGARADACREYPESGLRTVATAPLSSEEKAAIILSQFMSLSEGATRTEKNYELVAERLLARGVAVPVPDLEAVRRTSTLNAVAAMDRLIADLRRARPGEAYVAHILLPHYPYVMTADCRLKPVAQWQVRDAPAPRRERELHYFEQLRCATAKIDAALQALAASPGGKQAIVVIHGDHGSRITDVDPHASQVGEISGRDLIAGYSTLLAVRARGVAPGYDPAAVAVRSQLSRLAQSGFGRKPVAPPAAAAAAVVLPGGGPTAPSQPLPADW